MAAALTHDERSVAGGKWRKAAGGDNYIEHRHARPIGHRLGLRRFANDAHLFRIGANELANDHCYFRLLDKRRQSLLDILCQFWRRLLRRYNILQKRHRDSPVWSYGDRD